MSCNANDILIDNAIDKIDEIMNLNPSIPEEMRNELVKEEYFKSLKEDEDDPGDYEPQTPEEMDKADAYWESLRKGEE